MNELCLRSSKLSYNLMMFGWSCRNGSDSFEFLGLKKMFHSVLHMFQKAQTRKGEETYLVQLTSQRRNMFWRRCSKDSLNSSGLSIIDSVIQWLSPSSSWWQSLAWSARGFSSSPAANQHSCRVVQLQGFKNARQIPTSNSLGGLLSESKLGAAEVSRALAIVFTARTALVALFLPLQT